MEPQQPGELNRNVRPPMRQTAYVRRDTVRGRVRVSIQDIRPLKASPTLAAASTKSMPLAPRPIVDIQPHPTHTPAAQNPMPQHSTVPEKLKPQQAGRKQQRSQVVMRKIVEKPQPELETHTDSPKKRNKKSLILTIMAVLVFLAGIAVSYDGWRTNKKIEEQVTRSAASSSESGTTTNAPSTEKPSDGAVTNYVVAPDMPRYFKMPQHGITKARILPMGVDKNNTLKSPNNVHDVGWYDASSRPGQGGAVLLDAHVSSWTTDGVFYHIKDLKPGDTVSVERGDGQEFSYRVVKTETYDYKNVDMTAAILPVTGGKNGLNMITCAGKVIPGTNEFDKRIIVFTEQV